MTFPSDLEALTQQASDYGFVRGVIVGILFGLGVLAFLLIIAP